MNNIYPGKCVRLLWATAYKTPWGKETTAWAPSPTHHCVIVGCSRNAFQVPGNAPLQEGEFWNPPAPNHLAKLICECKPGTGVWISAWGWIHNQCCCCCCLSAPWVTVWQHSPGNFYNFPWICSLGFSASFRMILAESNPDVRERQETSSYERAQTIPCKAWIPSSYLWHNCKQPQKILSSFGWRIIKWITYTGHDSAKHLTTQLTWSVYWNLLQVVISTQVKLSPVSELGEISVCWVKEKTHLGHRWLLDCKSKSILPQVGLGWGLN